MTILFFIGFFRHGARSVLAIPFEIKNFQPDVIQLRARGFFKGVYL